MSSSRALAETQGRTSAESGVLDSSPTETAEKGARTLLISRMNSWMRGPLHHISGAAW